VLAPASCQEGYDLTILAFELAFKYRNPVVILGDAILGQMKEPVVHWKTREIHTEEAEYWALSGARGREPRLLKSLYLADGALAEHNRRLQDKYQAMQKEVRFEDYELQDAEVVAVAFGSIGRIVKSTVRKLRRKGKPVGLFRPISLFPFPEQTLRDLAKQGKKFITIENNAGQMVEDVRLAIRGYSDSAFYGNFPGQLSKPEDFEEPILKLCSADAV